MSIGKQVIIIGAGPAGLATAHHLLAHSAPNEYCVTVLEESDAIGGISKTVSYKGNRMDLGGHRFFTKAEPVSKWWAELLPMTDPEKSDAVFMERSRLSRIYFNNTFFPYPITLSPRLLVDLGLVDSLKVIGSYCKSLLFKRKENSLEDFYINRFGKQLYSMFFEYYTENLWGVHPRDISPEWGYQRVKGLSILAAVKDMLASALNIKAKKETSLIDRFHYPKYGPGQLWEEAARQVEKLGGKIVKNAKVTGVTLSHGCAQSVTCLLDGKETRLSADFVVSSMPLKDLIAGMNDVPDPVQQCASQLPYRDFVTIGVLLPKSAIAPGKRRNADTLQDNWIYVQDRRVKMGRIQIFNNWSPYMVSDPENTVWMALEYFCNEPDELWSASGADFAAMAVAELRRIGIICEDANFLDYHIEHVRKAYPSYFGSYENIDLVRSFIDQIPNLICVGRNGQHRYNNMDHSVLTGFEAADYILGNQPDKGIIWNVNTEKEYLEDTGK